MKMYSSLAPALCLALASILPAQAQVAPASAAPSVALAPTYIPTPSFNPGTMQPRIVRPSLWRAVPALRQLQFANSRWYIDTYQQAQAYGRCVTRVSTDAAQDFLAAAPNSADERWQLIRMRSYAKACLPYGYRAPVVFLRAAVAESLYRTLNPGDTVHAAGVTQAQFVAFKSAEADRSWARLADDRLFTGLANCLVVRAPAATRNVLYARPGSRSEMASLDRLLSEAPACVDRTRFPRDGGRMFLRAYLAESAWRWANTRV